MKMRRVFLPLAVVAAAQVPFPVLAQSTTEERDRGFLAGLIEDNLSAPGLSVRIDGFSGALSSAASIDVLQISDEQGIWLRMENVVLDWNRSALLRGRLEVQELSAELIALERAPLPAEGVEALPDAGASGFSLPDLPVSVDIQALTAQRIELGAALLGQEMALSLDASAQLANGSGTATIEAQRLDGTTGSFSIAASYDRDTQNLSVNLDVAEAQGGIAATLLQLPGRPAIELTVKGDGPLDAFVADIAIASDGVERLGGQVTLNGTEDGRRFAVDLGGDVTSLFAPRYQDFFGDDVALVVGGLQRTDGRLDLETLNLRTKALSLNGEARLGADGWPVFVDITGRVAAEDGTTVLLPSAANSQLREADLSIRHNASVSDNWALDLSLLDYSSSTVTLGDAAISATGILSRRDGVVETATATITSALNQLGFTNPALAQAVGPRVSLDADVAWQSGQPVRLTGLRLSGPGYGLSGTIEVDNTDAERPLTVTLDLAAMFEDLSRLSGISGQDLSGTADATVTGDYAPLAGTFDLMLGAVAQDLALNIPQADAVLEGETSLTLATRRTVDGTFVDALRLGNAHLTANGSAALLSKDSAPYLQGERSKATFNARLADGTRIDPRLDGPIELAVNATQNEVGAWQGTLDALAPEGVTVSASGTLTGEAPDVTFAATVPRLEPFAPGVPGGLGVNGRAFATDGIWSVDVDAAGPYDLTAKVAGRITGPAPEIAFEALLPDLTAPVPALAETPALQGAVSLDGTLAQIGGAWVVDTSISAPSDITLRAVGPVTGDMPKIEFAGTIPQISDVVPAIEGRVDLDGTLEKTGTEWAADVSINGPYDARVTARTILTRTPLRVNFTADIDDLSPLVPVPGGVSVAGEALRTDTGFRIDVDGTGPYSATLDATVNLVDGVPDITATGQVPDAGALVPQLRGPLNYDVTATQTGGQWRVTADVDGAQALSASVTGIATGPDAALDFRLGVGNVAVFAPGLNGALNASGRLFQQNGQWATDLDASGPLNSTLTAQGVLTGPSPQATFTLSVPNIAPLVPDLPGPLRVAGTAQQRDNAWALDINLDGPSGTTAAVAGDVGTDGNLNLSVNGSAPLGLANTALAPNRLTGIARFDLNVNGPPSLDSVTGTVTTTNTALSLPSLQNGLDNINTTVTLQGGEAQIALTAAPQTGGRIELNGPVTLSAPFNASLAANFDVTLSDPKLYTAQVSGRLAVNGPLTGGAIIGGTININEAEIAVPSSGLTAIGDLPDIRHVSSPRPVQRTLELAGQSVNGEPANGEAQVATGPGYGLDLTINAPGRIFVRGRGLDAELGGTLRLTGTTNNMVTTGGFELVRGRLDILEQRFDLDEGRITFLGSFMPYIRLVAVTETDTITASIVMQGPADDIEVTFESTPEVPQEEIVAQIFFGRDLSQLSPLQALQLANSIAILAGRGSGGLLDNLRGSAGLDDLDVTTDADGNVALRAGKYVSDNVYTDVEINQKGEAEISLNLDVTPNLTVRGSAGATGATSLGLFYEKDY